jgi:hypothetical protein
MNTVYGFENMSLHNAKSSYCHCFSDPSQPVTQIALTH